jgi:hypothetical protein
MLFTDADLSAPITEAPKLIDPIADGVCDVTWFASSRSLPYWCGISLRFVKPQVAFSTCSCKG